jgi:hypothetical protein
VDGKISLRQGAWTAFSGLLLVLLARGQGCPRYEPITNWGEFFRAQIGVGWSKFGIHEQYPPGGGV